jgi:hypothetical protein
MTGYCSCSHLQRRQFPGPRKEPTLGVTYPKRARKQLRRGNPLNGFRRGYVSASLIIGGKRAGWFAGLSLSMTNLLERMSVEYRNTPVDTLSAKPSDGNNM